MLYLNGKIISETDAKIAPDDRGFLLGDGLFETMRCRAGSPVDLDAHWDRLQAGANYLQLPVPLSQEEAQHTIEQLLTANGLHQSASTRITITRGAGPRGIAIPQSCTPTILITVFPRAISTDSTSLCTSEIRINEQSPLTRFKTLHYLDKIIARQHALNRHFSDALLLNTQGRIVSATTANIFFVTNETLHTPAIEEGALPGVTRGKIINFATEKNIRHQEGAYTQDDLLSATEVFITNSIIGIQRVDTIDNNKVKISPSSLESLLQPLFQ